MFHTDHCRHTRHTAHALYLSRLAPTPAVRPSAPRVSAQQPAFRRGCGGRPRRHRACCRWGAHAGRHPSSARLSAPPPPSASSAPPRTSATACTTAASRCGSGRDGAPGWAYPGRWPSGGVRPASGAPACLISVTWSASSIPRASASISVEKSYSSPSPRTRTRWATRSGRRASMVRTGPATLRGKLSSTARTCHVACEAGLADATKGGRSGLLWPG